ncbi:MAG: BrnT family toxin [Ectothiorhodospiraceae bacterium]
MVVFEWDPEKAFANQQKHGISFKEAKSVFFDEYARQFFDEEHSSAEERFVMLGLSNRLRILVVCHCERSGGNVVRIISARKATRNECDHYEGPSP